MARPLQRGARVMSVRVAGRRILVTRARDEAERWAKQLSALGATPVDIPVPRLRANRGRSDGRYPSERPFGGAVAAGDLATSGSRDRQVARRRASGGSADRRRWSVLGACRRRTAGPRRSRRAARDIGGARRRAWRVARTRGRKRRRLMSSSPAQLAAAMTPKTPSSLGVCRSPASTSIGRCHRRPWNCGAISLLLASTMFCSQARLP